MSRNVQKKVPASRKVAKRRASDSSTSSSSLNLSDDDGGYSAIEDISDSEDDDEEAVDAAEEEHILTHPAPNSVQSSPRPVIEEYDEEDGDDEEADDDDDDDDDEDITAGLDDVDDNASWDGIVSDVDETVSSDNHATPHRAAHERHVRFADVPSSDSDSTDTDDDHADFFPDLFVDQNTLDPAFRRELEDDDDDASSTASGTYWDFHGVYEYNPSNDAEMEAIIQELENDQTTVTTAPFPLQEAAEVVPASARGIEEIQDLDGYETDGDTTEEEEETPAPVRRKTRRPSTVEQSDSEAEPVKGSRGQPRLGRFNLDSSERKPIAVVNPVTRKMMIFTPHRRRHLDLSPEQFNMPHFGFPSSPMVGSSGHIMMSAMYSGNQEFGDFGDLVTTQAMGPAEAFFPFPAEGPMADDSSDIPDGEEDEAERSLDIGDFLTFDGSSNVDPAEDIDRWCHSDAVHSTPARPTTANSDVDMLSHINASNVGAFRRDQINQRLILSEKATQDSLAFSSPYNYTALRGIKSDRFETAAAPLTPMRRQKRQVDDNTRSPLESASQKRKASSEHTNSHKRHRSISDVNQLRI